MFVKRYICLCFPGINIDVLCNEFKYMPGIYSYSNLHMHFVFIQINSNLRGISSFNLAKLMVLIIIFFKLPWTAFIQI